VPPRFIDTNVLLRYFTRDDEEKAQRALELLNRVERGEERVETLAIVIFETVFTLQTFYQVARPRIRDLLIPILDLPGLRLVDKDLLRNALDLYVARRRLSFADAYHAAYVLHQGEGEMYTWDRGFDGIPGFTRVEP